MTESHVFPNYLIHYHFLPQKVNKYPFVLNVTGDYLWISLVISLLGGEKSPGSTLASCKGLHQGEGDGLEGLEHPIEFGSENNLGSIWWELESKLKGSWLNISSVPIILPQPSALRHWEPGHQSRDRKWDLLWSHRMAILYTRTQLCPG